MLERLQKIISAAGVSSRRAAEELIAGGRVRVNGQVVTELGSKADASKDHIKVDGKLINPKQPMTYIMLNKPAGYVTTMSDPEGRPTVQNLMKGVKVRVYPVGRLDYNTEGMLIMTNDGDFAHLVTHPKHELPKTYLAKLKGVLDEKAIESLETGVFLDDGKTAPAKVKKVRKEEANSWVEITIHEGRKRQVRRMFDRVGRSVIKLKRTKTGNLLLGELPEGAFRYLTHEEVQGLKELAQETWSEARVKGQEFRGQGDKGRRTTDDRREPTEGRRETREWRPELKVVRREATERRREPRDERGETRRPKIVHKGKPDVRPWRAATRGDESRRETWSAVRDPGSRGQGARRETRQIKTAHNGKRTGTWAKGPERAGSGAPRKSDAGKKPGVKPWATSTRGAEGRRETWSRVRGPGSRGQGDRREPTEGRREPREYRREATEAGRRPSSGPRPNRSSRPTGKGPGRGAKFGGRGAGRKR